MASPKSFKAAVLSLLLMAAIFGVPPARGQARRPCRPVGWIPTRLGNFIRNTPGADVKKQLVGTLTGRGTARFFAVTASGPAGPGATTQGMEIDLTDGQRNDRLYADKDSLRMFEHNMKGTLLPGMRAKIRDEERREPPGAHFFAGASASAAKPRFEPCEVPATVQIGVYFLKDTREHGVSIQGYRWNRSPALYFFPNADLSRVVQFIAAVRERLQAN